MLRIKIELVPFGVEENARVINTMVIANDGDDNYEGWVAPDAWTGAEAQYGQVAGHDRTLSVWTLVSKMIAALGATPETDLAARLKERL